MTATYLDESRPFPYCAGCGHPHVLRAVDEALKAVGVPPERVAIVTDIGCVGLADSLFPAVHTVHTLHGRSTAVAAGLRMGQRAPDGAGAKPIVLIGDGGAGIGLLHLVHAAQLNVGLTVIVHDNLVYGMTGGQHSVLTPLGLRTSTTPDGNPVPPLDLCAVLGAAGASFLARTLAPGDELAGILAEAMRAPGFACVEVLELCPTFATAVGGVTGRDLKAMPSARGLPMGVLRRDGARPEIGRPRPASPRAPETAGIAPERGWTRLDRTARMVVAGRAGERVQSAALLAASAAAAAGLEVTVRTDNPVTQGSGFSIAEVTVAPEPIAYTALVSPDLVVATAPEGLAELASRGLLRPEADVRRLVLDASLEAPALAVPAERQDLRKRFGGKGAALGALAGETLAAGWWDRRAWEAAVERLPPERRAQVETVLRKASEPREG